MQRFHRAFAPFEYLSVVVAQELREGVKRTRDRKALERSVLNVFERSGRMFAPSASAWHRSGDGLSDMGRIEGLENDRDFLRIRRHVSFEFAKPWPGGALA